jgi:hypothetical protein
VQARFTRSSFAAEAQFTSGPVTNARCTLFTMQFVASRDPRSDLYVSHLVSAS